MEVKWIKITTNIFDDQKIKLIDAMPERDAVFVIWIKLLTLAGQINDNGQVYVTESIPYTDEMLSTIFNRPLNTIRMAIKIFQDLEMIDIINNRISIINWEKHQNISGLDKIREQNKIRQQKYRENHKQFKSNVIVTQHNETDKIRIDIDKEKEYNKYISIFDNARKIYPGKKRGNKTEFDNFVKKHKDWKDNISLLELAITIQQQWRIEMQTAKMFVSDWKNFQTWINQRCWEEEKPVIINRQSQHNNTKTSAQLKKEQADQAAEEFLRDDYSTNNEINLLEV